jgi:capsular exopolysaccharide synthesis family protein
MDYEDNLLQHFGVNENISEVFKTIRANLQFQMKQQNVKTLLITSSNTEDGKSFISANLAIIMAMNGKKTVYIDADLRKPRGRILFNIKNNLGIMSYITGYSTFPDIIQKTEFDHLSFIGAGPLQPNFTEILSSIQMKEIIEQLKQQFDVIIIDSPPLIIADTLNLATIVDGCVFVINAQKTRKEHAKESVNQLTKIKVKMIVTILNKGKKVKGKTDYY